ncbi:LysR family transcriptional regulator [Paraburkholderia sp. 1N]|uniref:LysR family transcriptional regulator n=1 Tax=Paraburkholderia solitsugae TaxID=2675748 RepID=A0ABX2C1U1_9BURK|nr:LysR family transcriptional regulator [Paraburkholderia solitsugae]NPT47004.1 LysR family transcriptional regulator [Paraburkholderia solitsugae]
MRSKLARYMTNLGHFATVVEYGNISAASSVLGITQPALTRSIMRLEDVLGTQVLHRSARGVSPTECGKALMDHIQAAESELNKALAMVQAIRGVNDGRINCGAGSVSMNHILPTAVSRAKRKLGKIQINLIEGRTHELLYKLKNCELDMVLGIEQTDSQFADLRSECLIEEQFHFCVRAGHPLTRQPELSLGDLMSREQLVMPVLTSSPVERALNLELSRHSCELGEHRVETLSHAVMRHLVYQDDYVAFCSSIWFRDDIRSGALKVLKGNWHVPQFATLLFRRSGDVTTPWLSYFVNEIKNAAAELRSGAENPTDRTQTVAS